MTARPPPGLDRAVARALGVAEPTYRGVSGGCIANAARVDGPDGALAFLKWSSAADPASATYAAEADGLAALGDAGAVRVPRVLGLLETPPASGLLLEWLEPARPTPRAWRTLGTALARLHRTPAPEAPGWPADNFIGPLPQANAPAATWSEFWWSRRLVPQLERARGLLGALARRMADLEARLPELLAGAEADARSLLHGDLWRGNVHFTTTAPAPGAANDDRAHDRREREPEAALVDPSAYAGHREVDLAMADLFGGFPDAFWTAYGAEAPLSAGWRLRRPVYQLYYLLVHVNLFGESYLGAAARALEELGV